MQNVSEASPRSMNLWFLFLFQQSQGIKFHFVWGKRKSSASSDPILSLYEILVTRWRIKVRNLEFYSFCGSFVVETLIVEDANVKESHRWRSEDDDPGMHHICV